MIHKTKQINIEIEYTWKKKKIRINFPWKKKKKQLYTIIILFTPIPCLAFQLHKFQFSITKNLHRTLPPSTV